MLSFFVNASKSYPITIGSGKEVFAKLNDYLRGEKVALITDDSVDRIYGGFFDGLFEQKSVYKFVIPHGEGSKNAENYIKILNWLAKNDFTRSDAVVAFGGGVVGDLAAFVASTYMRGIGLIAVPTTILSAVDSSVGGKTAVNLDEGKNLCGTFYQPDAVFIDVDFFSSLDSEQISCGYGEIIKYAFLSNSVTTDDIKGPIGEELVYKCLKIKAEIVEADERETGARKLLNLGHTIGHAIEKLSGFSISHGDCVAKGLFAILNVSKKYYSLSDGAYRRALEIISLRGHDLSDPFPAKAILEQIRLDKKSGGNYVDAVLICEDLSAKTERISFDKLKELIG